MQLYDSSPTTVRKCMERGTKVSFYSICFCLLLPVSYSNLSASMKKLLPLLVTRIEGTFFPTKNKT